MLKIRKMRLDAGLTQKELAERIGAAWYNVGDWVFRAMREKTGDLNPPFLASLAIEPPLPARFSR